MLGEGQGLLENWGPSLMIRQEIARVDLDVPILDQRYLPVLRSVQGPLEVPKGSLVAVPS